MTLEPSSSPCVLPPPRLIFLSRSLRASCDLVQPSGTTAGASGDPYLTYHDSHCTRTDGYLYVGKPPQQGQPLDFSQVIAFSSFRALGQPDSNATVAPMSLPPRVALWFLTERHGSEMVVNFVCVCELETSDLCTSRETVAKATTVSVSVLGFLCCVLCGRFGVRMYRQRHRREELHQDAEWGQGVVLGEGGPGFNTSGGSQTPSGGPRTMQESVCCKLKLSLTVQV